MIRTYARDMSPTVQVRDLDTQTLERLKEAADRERLTLSAFLRRELADLAKRLDVRHRAELLNIAPDPLRFGPGLPGLENVSTQHIVDIIREQRGPIP